MKTEVSVVVETEGRHRKLKLPPKIFTTAAEQLRFDALKTGNLAIEEWSKVKASVSLVCLGKEKPTKEFAFVVTLTGASKDIRVLYKPAELQRLRLYIEAQSPDALSSGSLELYWYRNDALAVPLAPLKLPIPPESAFVRATQEKTLDVKRSRLLVRDKARKQLVELFHRSFA